MSALGASPRKGRHTRSQALSSSSNSHAISGIFQASSDLYSNLPAGLDPLTLDSDDVFTRLEVRQIQSIEGNLRSSHDALTARLRKLVSERYRDMLSTANTLIDLSSSSNNLVQHLEDVITGTEKAKTMSQDRSQDVRAGLTGRLLSSRKDIYQDLHLQEKKAEKELFELTTTTRLISEAPDELWQAMSAAMYAFGQGSSKSPNARVPSSLTSPFERYHFGAAMMLRAAWIYKLTMSSWRWLIESQHDENSTLLKGSEVISLFPYISHQWKAAQQMKEDILRTVKIGLAGSFLRTQFPRDKGRRRFTLSHYVPTSALLLSVALLDEQQLHSIRDILLECRGQQLRRHIVFPDAKSGLLTDGLGLLLFSVSETLLQTMQGFALLSGNEKETHFSRLYAILMQSDIETKDRDLSLPSSRPDYPPGAFQVIQTLPSSAVLSTHLPLSIRSLVPSLKIDDSVKLREDTLIALESWCQSLRKGKNEVLMDEYVQALDTVDDVGKALVSLWSGLDQGLAKKHISEIRDDQECVTMVNDQLRGLTLHIHRLLVRRLEGICQARGKQLSNDVAQGIMKALEEFSPAPQFAKQTSKQDVEYLREKKDHETAILCETLDAANAHKDAFLGEVESCIFTIRKFQARKKLAEERNLASHDDINQVPVHEYYHDAIMQAKAAAITTLQETGNRIMSQGRESKVEAEQVDETRSVNQRLLLIVRLVSVVRHSQLFDIDSAISKASKQDDLAQMFEETHHNLLADWAKYVVQDALDKTRRVRTDDTLSFSPLEDISEPLRPSAALLQALSILIKGYHVAECNFHDEALWLRKRFLWVFANKFVAEQEQVQASDAQARMQFLLDIDILSALQGPNEGSVILSKTRDRVLADLPNFDLKQHQAILHSCFASIRLLLITLAVDETSLMGSLTDFSKQTVPSNTLSSKTSFGPLPPLRSPITKQ